MRVLMRLQQLVCRHEDVLKLGESRMWLECLACGRVTTGFDGIGCRVRPDVDVVLETPRVGAAWVGPCAVDRAA